MSIVINGFTPDDKVPGAVAINEWGAGPLSIGAIPLRCFVLGNKTSGGDANLNEAYPITTPEEALARFGPRAEVARQCYAALDIAGVTLYGVAVAEAPGAASATLAFQIGGSWSTSGEVTYQFGEEVIRVAVAASHTPTTYGDAAVSALNQAQNGRLASVASNNAGKVTSTIANPGVRGNQHVAFADVSKAPAGFTFKWIQLTPVTKSGAGPAITVDGSVPTDGTWVITISTGGTNGTAQFGVTKNGSPVASGVTVPTTPFQYTIPGTTVVATFGNGTHILNETHTFSGTAALSNGFQPFFGGTGTDDIDDALDGNESVTMDYIAPAANDVTNVGKVEAKCNEKAGFEIGRLENYVVSTGGSLAAAIALGQTGMNDQLGSCLWVQNSVEHPSRIAARAAAYFSVTEGADPNHNYDDEVLPGAAPQAKQADNPNRATLKSALNNSITPLVTEDGKLKFIRAICSRSLSGSTPDYRTYDRGDVVVSIRCRKEFVALANEMREANPYAGPDVAEGLPPTGTLTPNLWKSKMYSSMKEWEGPAFNWLEQVDERPPEATWDRTGKRIMSVARTTAKTQNHQIGIIVRQQAA